MCSLEVCINLSLMLYLMYIITATEFLRIIFNTQGFIALYLELLKICSGKQWDFVIGPHVNG